MKIEFHLCGERKIAELVSETIVIHSADEGLDLLGEIYYRGADALILQQQNIAMAFFDLKTGMAGELLQKFSNYRVRLAVVGNFDSNTSESLRDFIRESNKQKQINFVTSLAEALRVLTN